MNRQESKAPLVLMEQVIMVLVFALVAALCIQAFVLARTLSLRMIERDRAMNMSQTLAETLKASGGDTDAVAGKLKGESVDGTLQFFYDEEWKQTVSTEASYVMVFEQHHTEGFCKTGVIRILDCSDEREISSMNIAWQGAEADE